MVSVAVLGAATGFASSPSALAAPSYTLSAGPSGLEPNGFETFTGVLPIGQSFTGDAGELSLDVHDNSAGTDTIIQAWCVNAYNVLSLPATFSVEPLSAVIGSGTVLNDINALIGNGAALAAGNAVASAALQYAIWEVEYETTATYDVTTGTLQITASTGDYATVTSLANSYVNNVVTGAWQPDATATLEDYYAGNNQSVVTLVPEPGALSILGAGLLAIGLLRRGRRKL